MEHIFWDSLSLSIYQIIEIIKYTDQNLTMDGYKKGINIKEGLLAALPEILHVKTE